MSLASVPEHGSDENGLIHTSVHSNWHFFFPAHESPANILTDAIRDVSVFIIFQSPYWWIT